MEALVDGLDAEREVTQAVLQVVPRVAIAVGLMAMLGVAIVVMAAHTGAATAVARVVLPAKARAAAVTAER